MVFYVGYIIPDWSKKKFDRFMGENRGSGRGKEYKPWITVPDGPKEGRCSRPKGWKTNRIHHFLSDNETRLFYIAEWSNLVIDIREQYPILEYERAMNVANKAGISYPVGKDGFPYILTTDFLFTITVNGTRKEMAKTVKPEQALDDKRVLELLEIERRYWREKNVDWDVVTDKKISEVFCRNVELVHSFYQYTLEGVSAKSFAALTTLLKRRLSLQAVSIFEVCTDFDIEMGFESGTSLSIVKHLIARKEISIDMFKPFDTFIPTGDIKICNVPESLHAIRGS